MRKLTTGIVLSALASSISAVTFSPSPLRLSAPETIRYDFDGRDLNIPVTVSGAPGTGALLIFTREQGASIGKVQNGHLGWHYVNNIDTCLYASPFLPVNRGTNIFQWNGRDDDGAVTPSGEYTYYIWAVDTQSPRIQMTRHLSFSPWNYRTILTRDTEGNPLSQPIVYTGSANRSKTAQAVDHILSKWVVGGDPQDGTLRETTSAWGWCAVGGLAFHPENYRYFFMDTLREAGLKITQKWEWVPNGASISQTEWGEKGQASYFGAWPAGWNFGPGVVSDGRDYLFVVNADISGIGQVSELIYLDVADGAELKRLDLSEWWVDLNDGLSGGQYCGGPTELFVCHDQLALGSHGSCVNMLIDPYSEQSSEAVKWANQNGDYTGDRNFEPEAQRLWVCNDHNVGPYKYNISLDDNLFTVFPYFDMGAVSFGLYAPDGTGLGYLALAGETARQKYGVELIDYGSPYDGLYTTNNTGAASASGQIDASFWYVGYDSIKGVITQWVDVRESSPAPFAVSQNVPNPFNPETTINFTIHEAGKTTIEVFNSAGQKVDVILNANLKTGSHSATWNAARFPAGIYFYTVRAGGVSRTLKMTLIR